MKSNRKSTGVRHKQGWFWTVLSLIQVMVLVGLAVGMVLFVLAFWNVATIIPDIQRAAPTSMPESTKIFAENGELLAVIYEEQNREYVPLKEIPKHLIDATIVMEDRRFFEHSGVDVRGILRALWVNIRSKSPEQGASTITQQLARNVFLSRRKTLSRKIQEAILAVQLERKFTKNEILEMYLNQIFYGAGAYGVQAAAKVYFGKKVSELTLPECALLAAIPQRPSEYNPYHDKELAERRRNMVLDLMAEYGKISREEAEQAKSVPVRLAFKRPSSARIRRAPYFVDFVVKQLVERYGDQVVYRGGLRVYTTLHTGIQAAADRAIKEGIARFRYCNVTQGALVCLEPRSGKILAMVGGVDYEKSPLNRAYLVNHPRQAGSAFKPFVYAAALEAGMTPGTRILDAPVSYAGGPGGRLWRPRNYGGGYRGWVTMEQALALSINIPAIRTLNQIGIDRAIEMAHRLGITSPIPHNLSIAIGTSGVTVLEMASAYTAFATGGLHADPIAILRVEDKDRNVIEETVPRARRVLSQEVANQMDRMLRAVVLWGTASKGAGHIPEARGKTGTTQSERDAWFVGYTPQLLAAVWVGNDDNTPMRRATGGIVCAPIWASFMEEALKFRLQAPKVEIVSSSEDREPRRIRERRSSDRSTQEEASSSSDTADSDIISVPICDESGQLATEACPSTHMEQFPRDEAPTERCSLHPGTSPDRFEEPRPRSADAPSRASAPPPPEQLSGHGRPRPPELQTEGSTLPGARSEVPRVRVRLCRQTGLLATDFCPDTIQRSLPIDEVPKAKCNIHLTAPR